MTGPGLPDFATWRGAWTIERNGKLGLHPSYGHRTTAETVANYWRELQPATTFQAVPDVDYPAPCPYPEPTSTAVFGFAEGERKVIPSQPHTGG